MNFWEDISLHTPIQCQNQLNSSQVSSISSIRKLGWWEELKHMPLKTSIRRYGTWSEIDTCNWKDTDAISSLCSENVILLSSNHFCLNPLLSKFLLKPLENAFQSIYLSLKKILIVLDTCTVEEKYILKAERKVLIVSCGHKVRLLSLFPTRSLSASYIRSSWSRTILCQTALHWPRRSWLCQPHQTDSHNATYWWYEKIRCGVRRTYTVCCYSSYFTGQGILNLDKLIL